MVRVEYQPCTSFSRTGLQAHRPSTDEATSRLTARDAGFVFAVALALRWATVFELAESQLVRLPVGDARSYVDWAMRSAGGEGLGGEVFYQAPLYPYVLAGLFTVFGEGLFVPRLVQGLLGALACALLGTLAGRLGGRTVGRISGFSAALYAPWIWSDGLLQKTSLALFLLVGLLALCERTRRAASFGSLAVVGVVAGLLILTRENAAILLLPIGVFLARGGNAGRLVPLALGLASVLVPVGWRNWTLGDVFLPTASNVGVNLYIGNGPDADGFYLPLLPGRGHADYEARDARALAEARLGRELSPSQVSLHFAGLAFEEMAQHPGRALGLVGKKALLLGNDQEFMDATAFEAYREESWVLHLFGTTMRFGWLLPLALIGLVHRPRNELAWLLAASALALAVSLLPFFVTGRFRMGLVPLLLPFAGVGLRALVTREAASRPLLTAGLALAGLLVAWLPLAPPGDPIATSYANLASELLRRGDQKAAERWTARALELSPNDAAALYNRGVALKSLQRYEEAEAAFSATLQADERFAADAWAELGSLHALRERSSDAERSLARALALDPGHDTAHYYVGLLRRRQGDLEAAARAYELALARRPGFSDARHNLAHVHLARGRPAEAITSFMEGIERDPAFLPSRRLLALLLATHPDAALRDGTAALVHAERAMALSPTEDPELHATRAFALAELARFGEAVEALERARAIDPAPERWAAALEELRSGKPYHVDPTPPR